MDKLKQAIYCWKVDTNEMQKEDPHGIQINETKGEHAFQGKASTSTT